MLLNKSIRNIVIQNQKMFERLELKAVEEQYGPKAMHYINRAVNFAVKNRTLSYSSPAIEEILLKISKGIKCSINEKELNKVSCLHIMTEAYKVGGHTRVVERWIECGDQAEIHSVLTTEMSIERWPERLKSAVAKKSGQAYSIASETDFLRKANRLRQIASQYSVVILHTHMHDISPVLAFGTPEFKRPVLLYNHADHRFWVGLSIADRILETRSWGKKVTSIKRGIQCSEVLGIPVDSNILFLKRTKEQSIQARKKLNLPLDAKIIFSCGGTDKYKEEGEQSFLKLIDALLAENSNLLILVVGSNIKKLPDWKFYQKKNKENFRLLNSVPPVELYKYAMASDLVLDSFPMSGGTAMIDMTCLGLPVLSLECPTGHMDYMYSCAGYCKDVSDLSEKVKLLLSSEKAREINVTELQKKILMDIGPQSWMNKLKKIISELPKQHTIRKFSRSLPETLDDLDAYMVWSDLEVILNFNPFLVVYAFRGKRSWIFDKFFKFQRIEIFFIKIRNRFSVFI